MFTFAYPRMLSEREAARKKLKKFLKKQKVKKKT